MKTLNIDIETYCEVDLKKAGAFKYALDPSFELLLFGYSVDGQEVQIVDTLLGEEIPKEIIEAMLDPNVLKKAFNATFEWICLTVYLRSIGRLKATETLKIEQWSDTKIRAMYCSYPASLDGAGKAIGLAEDKKKSSTGKALIRHFCKPCKPTKVNGGATRNFPQNHMEKWELFKAYCKQDVVAEMEIDYLLSAHDLPQWLWDEWYLDAEQNYRGVQVDMDLVRGAIKCDDSAREELIERAREITGLSNPNSDAQLRDWINEYEGREAITSLAKEPLGAALKNLDTFKPITQELLAIRKELGKTSCKKFHAMDASACADNRIRGVIQFYGATRTGRAAGRLIQVQNLPRTHLDHLDTAREVVKRGSHREIECLYGTVTDTLSQLIRTALVPKDGHVFVDSDFSAIEARVLAWLAGEEWVLDVFRTHGKIYEANASRMFNVDIDKIKKGNPEYELRQSGKVAQLALGYGGGVVAIDAMDFDNSIPESDRPDIVQRWRRENPNIVKYWRAVENAAVHTVRTGRTSVVRNITFRYEIDKHGLSYLTVELPSGRKLFYPKPKMVQNRFGNESIGYMGIFSGRWMQLDTYGGKLTENITQAVSRDLLMYSITNLEKNNYPIAFHVHDEVVLEVPKDRANLQHVYDIMSTIPSWAEGLPLDADGWIGNYYTKD